MHNKPFVVTTSALLCLPLLHIFFSDGDFFEYLKQQQQKCNQTKQVLILHALEAGAVFGPTCRDVILWVHLWLNPGSRGTPLVLGIRRALNKVLTYSVPPSFISITWADYSLRLLLLLKTIIILPPWCFKALKCLWKRTCEKSQSLFIFSPCIWVYTLSDFWFVVSFMLRWVCSSNDDDQTKWNTPFLHKGNSLPDA